MFVGLDAWTKVVEEGWDRGSGGIELLPRFVADDPLVAQIAFLFRGRAARGRPMERLLADSVMTSLVAYLASNAANVGLPSPTRGGLAPWQIKRACDLMEARLDGEVTLGALAAAAGLSPTHFSRAFKRSTGTPPFAWLPQRRIRRAKDLLAGTGLPLAEAALAVGFAAQPQFTTAFRRVTGAAPGAWRRGRSW